MLEARDLMDARRATFRGQDAAFDHLVPGMVSPDGMPSYVRGQVPPRRHPASTANPDSTGSKNSTGSPHKWAPGNLFTDATARGIQHGRESSWASPLAGGRVGTAPAGAAPVQTVHVAAASPSPLARAASPPVGTPDHPSGASSSSGTTPVPTPAALLRHSSTSGAEIRKPRVAWGDAVVADAPAVPRPAPRSVSMAEAEPTPAMDTNSVPGQVEDPLAPNIAGPAHRAFDRAYRRLRRPLMDHFKMAPSTTTLPSQQMDRTNDPLPDRRHGSPDTGVRAGASRSPAEEGERPQGERSGAEAAGCAYCGNPAEFECSGCGGPLYCSQPCQASHWRTHATACTGSPEGQQWRRQQRAAAAGGTAGGEGHHKPQAGPASNSRPTVHDNVAGTEFAGVVGLLKRRATEKSEASARADRPSADPLASLDIGTLDFLDTLGPVIGPLPDMPWESVAEEPGAVVGVGTVCPPTATTHPVPDDWAFPCALDA